MSELTKAMRITDTARAVEQVVEQIKPLLAGRPSAVQGAVIADLLAIWLAGHVIAGDADATRKLRDDLLAAHLLSLEELVTVNARMMGTE